MVETNKGTLPQQCEGETLNKLSSVLYTCSLTHAHVIQSIHKNKMLKREKWVRLTECP